MNSWNKKLALVIICSLGLYFATQAQTIYYYRLTKTKIEGKVSTHKHGGQFICIYDDFCYDCDINGKGVGNGQLRLKSKGEYITYFGESYFGENSYYKFNTSFESLNIITPKGDIYVYKRDAYPSSMNTCSFIKSRRSSSTMSNASQIYSPSNPSISNNSNVNSDTHRSRQKTTVRKQCAYCSGKGERIQHEYVNTFGLAGPRVYCKICNQSWNNGTVHAHHKCNYCNGLGYYEYEY